MEKVRVEEVESRAGPADVKRPLTTALGATDLAVNYFELAPGDSFAFGYHAHSDQEEVFYVQSGTVTFETEEGQVEVSSGELVRFAPGEYQRGVNEAENDSRAVALALGAPQESGDLDLRRECSDCGDRTSNTVQRADEGAGLVTICEECGAETGRFE
ncbi:cupin domain-containing protein [Halorussus ruber]|uniref:cupin domain-containing protein n=1 Tax=Halorussus ruber TaxID=1126238 RepID=UPI00109250E5|nr:cupin domain-containing protein [Halorussus ruber]